MKKCVSETSGMLTEDPSTFVRLRFKVRGFKFLELALLIVRNMHCN